ncbi:tripartite tricarboxylate transporter permease [Bradyrhizobium sp. 182]|uniref:tripartite tricarboxylate transporter permease n=1 Tax=Bradyrhizobium sp. 182 TaxID=2782651 RepID=UPI00209725A0|nr:tripartite tricarboxylate transporter permease [Bradyrhizobium sp. 182]
MLVLLNVPLIGLWVKLLMIPYKYLYPSAVFFVAIGVISTNNDMFQVGETVVGLTCYLLLLLDFHPASILLGFVLGPRLEENFRRSLLVSRGDAMIFVERPISAFFLFLCLTLLAAQIYVRLRKPKAPCGARRRGEERRRDPRPAE